MEEGIKKPPLNGGISQVIPITRLSISVVLLVKFVQLIHQMWWIEFHKIPFSGRLSTGRWKTLAACVVAISSKGLQSLALSLIHI